MNALWAVVPAAGSGSRMASSESKQYLKIGGRSLLDWSVGALLAYPKLRACVVAVPETDVQQSREGSLGDARVSFCAGGSSRAASVAAALAALPAEDEDWVLVHDAARPCLAPQDLHSLVQNVSSTGVGGLLAVPITDTLKRADGQARVMTTIDRAGIWSAQTPQMFRVGELRSALDAARESGFVVTDEASAMEAAGFDVQLVQGSVANLKVTYASDMQLAAFWLKQIYPQDGDMAGTEI
ncbi:2-C-methyl-D-erythritol 4-phosphate cytidylyltransferase [Congregibacter variabilis]|uniref:2-C-methyl-D-erythritol 4-phosphate cytidylyltransferase n=1 Tax=Congregibacter variabilis TaxID=3081200 RepID=A0ABZ0I6E0_9GAMM|nr:2-C-methyl-D-erythritol 4-phosphate cytidylyltransferase [Congregibacter sp. IMCC43200]